MRIRATNLDIKLLGRLGGEWHEIKQVNFYSTEVKGSKTIRPKVFIEIAGTFKGYPIDSLEEYQLDISNKDIVEVRDGNSGHD